MKKSLIRYSFALLILLSIISSTSIVSLANSIAIGEDKLSDNGPGDLAKVMLWDDEEYLKIGIFWASPLPPPSSDYLIDRQLLWAMIDLDCNRKTGLLPGHPSVGAEALLSTEQDSNGSFIAQLSMFNSTGYYVGYKDYTNISVYNASGIIVNVPLTDLNLSVGNCVMMHSVLTMTNIYDIYDVSVENYVIRNASIVIDGNTSDWPSDAFLYNDGVDTQLPASYDLLGVYIAVDSSGNTLFLRFDRKAPLTMENISNYYNIGPYADIYIDLDNDTINDYLIHIFGNAAEIWNLHNNTRITLSEPDYQASSIINLTSMEIKINISTANLTIAPNSTLNLKLIIGTELVDMLNPVANLTLAEKTKGLLPAWSTRLYHWIGGPSKVIQPILDAFISGSGKLNLSLTTLNMTIEATNPIRVDLALYDGEPNGLNPPENLIVHGYYAIYISHPDYVNWPITIKIKWTNHNTPILYYYNNTLKQYIPLHIVWEESSPHSIGRPHMHWEEIMAAYSKGKRRYMEVLSRCFQTMSLIPAINGDSAYIISSHLSTECNPTTPQAALLTVCNEGFIIIRVG